MIPDHWPGAPDMAGDLNQSDESEKNYEGEGFKLSFYQYPGEEFYKRMSNGFRWWVYPNEGDELYKSMHMKPLLSSFNVYQ